MGRFRGMKWGNLSSIIKKKTEGWAICIVGGSWSLPLRGYATPPPSRYYKSLRVTAACRAPELHKTARYCMVSA